MDDRHPLPDDALLNILRKTSTFPNRADWVSFIAPEDALAVLSLKTNLSETARQNFTTLLTNHENLLAEIFDTGSLHARKGLSTVSIPERVSVQSSLYQKILDCLIGHLDRPDYLHTLDLDFLALDDSVIEDANNFCLGLRTLGMRHFFRESTLAECMIANRPGLRELFLSECDVSYALSKTLAAVHEGSLQLLSLTRVRLLPRACGDSFWKKIGPSLRELVYVCNNFEGAAARWKAIGRHCKRLDVLRFEMFDAEFNWFRAFVEMKQTSCRSPREHCQFDSPSEMWYRSLDNPLYTASVADPDKKFSTLRRVGEKIGTNWTGTVVIHEGKLVFVPERRTYAIKRKMPRSVRKERLVEYLNGLRPGTGFSPNLEPYSEDVYLVPHVTEYIFRHVSRENAPEESTQLHKEEIEGFEDALSELGPSLKKLYLYKWNGSPETTKRVADFCPSAEIHLDLTHAKGNLVSKQTDAVGSQLTELRLPESPNAPTISDSRVSLSCENLTRLSVWEGDGTLEHLREALESTGGSVTHLQYRSRRRHEYPECEGRALEIMGQNLSRLEKLVFDCRFIGEDAFRELSERNQGLKDVCIRVHHQSEVHAHAVERIAGWICTFAASPSMRSISIEQRDEVLDDIPYVSVEEVLAKVLERRPRMRWNLEIHIQVFSQRLHL